MATVQTGTWAAYIATWLGSTHSDKRSH